MSGGYFDYDQNRIKYIVERLESYLRLDNDYSKATVEKMHDGLEALRIAYIYAQRIDWLLSGDDGEESFHERLDEALSKIIPDFVQVGNNTLHGAIDYWQDRAHKAEQRLDKAESKLNSFEYAVEHVTETGKTVRSVSSSDGWAIVHKERLTDLEIAEERLAAAEGILAQLSALKRQRGRYLGTNSMGHEMYDAPYYKVAEVETLTAEADKFLGVDDDG